MIKVFISQPMSGIDEAEVMRIRGIAFENAKQYILHTEKDVKEEEIELLQTYEYKDAPEDAGRLWYLGRSIQRMGTADYIYFVQGYENAPGCLTEEFIAHMYNLNCVYESKDVITEYKIVKKKEVNVLNA